MLSGVIGSVWCLTLSENQTATCANYNLSVYILSFTLDLHYLGYKHLPECQHGLNQSWGSKEQHDLWWYILYLISKDLYVIECFQFSKQLTCQNLIKTPIYSLFQGHITWVICISQRSNMAYIEAVVELHIMAGNYCHVIDFLGPCVLYSV